MQIRTVLLHYMSVTNVHKMITFAPICTFPKMFYNRTKKYKNFHEVIYLIHM